MKGGTMGAWAGVFLMLIIQDSTAAPPSPTGTKRSDEIIQFGNQQNKPVSVLDEDALPGAFPSSETTENNDAETPTADPEEGDIEANNKRGEEVEEEQEEEEEQQEAEEGQEPPPPPSPPLPGRPLEGHHHLSPVSQHLAHEIPRHREEMISDLPPVALASRWRPPSEFYNPHWGLTVSPLYGAVEDGTFPTRRRRRSTQHKEQNPDPREVLQVSLHALRTGHRHKRDVHDMHRIRRDLSNIDLDKLRREVDVVELLSMLAKPPKHRNPGFATVTYAPLAPAPPRFAPQPKLFPDYEEEEDEDEEQEQAQEQEQEQGEDDEEGSMGLLRQVPRFPSVPGRVMLPPSDNRIWRRSGGYGLSAMPGFKRSAFRANTPAPSGRPLNPDDVYSLAAMLGAELDPVTHRLRRAAM